MYTKEDIKKIIEDFIKLDFYQLKVTNRALGKCLIDVNTRWPELMQKPKVLRYWLDFCTEDFFVDSLFCPHCGSFMNNRVHGWPKYCSKECRKANHNWSKNSESRKELEDFWESKYGCRNPLGSKEVRHKIETTLLERYGVKHNWESGSPSWEKIKKTVRDKYGTDYIVQSDYFKLKSIETLMEHYGVTSPIHSKEIRDKIEKTSIERYGVPNVFCSGSPIIDTIKQTNLQKYGVPYYCMTKAYVEGSGSRVSQVNKDFAEFLLTKGITSEFEKLAGWYHYDLCVLDNILIDINPSFTHSVTSGISNFKPKSMQYHYQRYLNAQVNGFKLIQVWDWDNWDKIVNSLRKEHVLYARQCELRELDKKTTKQFLNMYHYQNATRSSLVNLGLYYNDELVETMTFGKPRYANTEFELLRLCTKFNYRIIGGASKLLKYFERTYNPKKLISYCDLSKFDGSVYEQLGFEETRLTYSKHWYNYKTGRHITDNLLRQMGADRLIGTEFGKGTSNEDIMKLFGFIEVYDAGQKTFIKQYGNSD